METATVIVSHPQLYTTDAEGVTRAFSRGERVTLRAEEAEELESAGVVYRHFEPRPLPHFQVTRNYETKIVEPPATKSPTELAAAIKAKRAK